MVVGSARWKLESWAYGDADKHWSGKHHVRPIKISQDVVEMTEMISVEQIQTAPGNFVAISMRYDMAG